MSNSNFSGVIVLQTDFGTTDGTVNETKGVIHSIEKSLIISDLTHEIVPFNIFEAAYRLYQTATYWPEGTIFVSVVDPGVGTQRKSIILKSKTGHYFISPDNGTLTLINQFLGTEEIIEINEKANIMPRANSSTSHGRDLYCYVAARLASGKISLEEVGTKLSTELIQFHYEQANINTTNQLIGTIAIHDRYGNIWMNIDLEY
ncbi:MULTISPECIES: SAM hydrolase/SAM-dependent halogenase family protein [unclassified Candidatus Tisiphia]|uniref:SAM hydrolase/SAM-dependent halogenase family protein n=1 Tax=unclassified Candidatus Tisiphia TaxID=2996318 RepID=UPI0035C9187A